MRNYTRSQYPYLIWIKGHTHIYEYCDQIIYNKGEYVTIGRSLYQSTTDNNKEHPFSHKNWLRIR